MKINCKILNLSILVFLIFSACNKLTEAKLTIDLTQTRNLSEIELSLFIDDIIYIPLETTDDNLINRIWKTCFSDNYVYVKTLRELYKFQFDGSFNSQIGRRGRGPGEYNYLTDFCVDELNEIVYILDKNIKVYDNHNQFIKELNLNEGSTDQIELSEEHLLLIQDRGYGNEDYSNLFINKDGDIIKKIKNEFTYDADGYYIGTRESVFYKFNNNLYANDLYSDTVYQVRDLEFIPKYILQRGGATFTPEKRFKQQYENVIGISSFFETIQFLFIEYRKDKQSFYHIKEKKNGKEWTFDPEVGLINDIDGGPSFKPELYFTRNQTEYLAIWIHAFELKAHVESDAFKNSTSKYPEKKKELEELAASLDENDNPVLMLVTLKE